MAVSIIPLVLAVNIVVRHGAVDRTAAFGLPVVAVTALTVLPWLIDVVSAKFGLDRTPPDELTARRQHLLPEWFMPEWLFSLIVLTGVAVLIWDSVEVDPAPFLLVFLTGEMASRLNVRGGIAVAAASVIVMLTADLFGPYSDSFIWIVGIGFGYFGGFALQSQMRLATERRLAEKSLTERAAAEERQRIAREIHDVIAHSMSVTMLHVTAARMALERGRSTEALESLRDAETQGRNSLIDIRRTVGVLGPDESGPAPMPGVLDLPKLVNDFQTAGLDVTLSMEGAVDELPPGAGLSLYRIVQESLTNASKHAPGGKTSVDLNVTESDIRLRVFNESGNGSAPAASAGGGRGVRGMAERAVMLNGSLYSGPEIGGWLVFLAAPRPVEE